MYCLIEVDEIVGILAKRLIQKKLSTEHCSWDQIRKLSRRYKKGMLEVDDLENYIQNRVSEDLANWKDHISVRYKKLYRPLIKFLTKNFERLANTPKSRESLIKNYINSNELGFIKKLGPQLTDSPKWITKKDYIDSSEPLLIRNVLNHEDLLKSKLGNKTPFWFIDSGYTNFLHNKRKPWHRIVFNHIHHQPLNKYFPPDRLSMLPSFPRAWRTQGNKVLIVESSQYYYSMHGTTLGVWRRQIKEQIMEHSNLLIEFREKILDKKSRNNLYDDLKDSEEYYCVITDSSAAAIEAIWLGIPVITLNRHITNSVSRSKIKDINNLYRGPIGNWLCELTYSQFTFAEICNGTARSILKEYHNV